MTAKHIAIAIGTRPEAIKMAPVVAALKKREVEFKTTVIATGQHRQMLDQALSLFEITPDIDLALMQPDQTLSELTSRVIKTIDKTLLELKPDMLLVQGDTTTVMAASLAAFYQKIPVGHVEAGLRSHDRYNPFPEEINRHITSILTEIHFAPTQLAREKLLAEGVASEKIVVTGNTVIDSLLWQLNKPMSLQNTPIANMDLDHHRLLLVTSHRRESFGPSMENLCRALIELEETFPDLLILYPVHLNPKVRETVMPLLRGHPRIFLAEPLDYLTFIHLMKACTLILTDSGGVQEEAPALQKPLLVLRKLTERPEAFQAGLAKVVGNDAATIVAEATRLLTDRAAYRAMTSEINPYGDGQAGERIAQALSRWAAGSTPWLEQLQQYDPQLTSAPN